MKQHMALKAKRYAVCFEYLQPDLSEGGYARAAGDDKRLQIRHARRDLEWIQGRGRARLARLGRGASEEGRLGARRSLFQKTHRVSGTSDAYIPAHAPWVKIRSVWFRALGVYKRAA